MHWVLQDNMFNETGYADLIDALVRNNISFSQHKVIPFIGEIVPAPTFDTTNVMCMGSYSLRHYAQKMGWTPGVFDLEPFDFTQQMVHWKDYLLNADSVVCRFEDAVFTSDTMFVRPIQDSKVFSGGVMSRESFTEWQHNVCKLDDDYGDSLTKDTIIQLNNLQDIYAEYRFWIVRQKIVTASLYKRGNRVIHSSQVDVNVHDFVNMVLNTEFNVTNINTHCQNVGWRPQEAFVIDIADTPNGFKIVEINTINSSGFYAGDMNKLVLTLHSEFSQV